MWLSHSLLGVLPADLHKKKKQGHYGPAVAHLSLQNCLVWHSPFPKQQILDSSKLKEFADDYSMFDENGRKFSKRVENTVGNGEIARYEQFLLFPQCFQKTCTVDT